ncbi:Glyoxylase, beta-lactamase superfamily II [Geosporobacter subterraneus DSM 17957]|uniref:Glyoxylase, beta-lactamase superfamily II n=1 Tax=Geosporobacter subterraneus DSM 17957 TaxID=1121919 RepID=A0A1M6BSQ8_9FIRM|nr:MBL fold metallo-hydrolase [Geosporobacter subterraneus]SHI51737.1 Glyoxylase, beta-lactamase superfamily II [Geosporobacter subterraneus DSM 17957]
MLIERIPAGVYAANCYVITCEETGKAAIIDPGGDAKDILKFIENQQLELSFILLTHGHGDHIGGVADILSLKKVPVYIHREDAYLLSDADKNLSSFMSGPKIEVEADRLLEDQEIIELGKLKLKILHTPGHTLGSICVFVEDVVFTGDTLFANSIGRTDLEGGSFKSIIQSILLKLFTLPDETKVMPGHGPASTISIEKLTNPFVNQ